MKGEIDDLSCFSHLSKATKVQEAFKEASCEIREQLLRQGAIVLKGITPSRDARIFEGIMNSLNFDLRDYVGGSSPRSTVKGKVMEATRTPADWSIILHQEMAYVKKLPEVIAFVCVEPAENGGNSTIGDMRQINNLIKESSLNLLQKRGLKLRRTLPSEERVKLKPGVKKSWQETFSTSSRLEAELICKARGWEYEWNSKDLVLWQDTIDPMRKHPITGASIWCNQAHFWGATAMIEWAKLDNRKGDIQELTKAQKENSNLLEAMCFSDGEPLPDELSFELFHMVRDLESDVHLNPGDILLLDNFQFSHGRRAFSGNRKNNVIIANWDK